MDSRSLASAKRPEEYTFTIKWDIHNFHLVLDLYNDHPIFSHSVKIYYHGLSFWRLGLHSIRDPLEFFLIRLPYIADEHDKIFVRYKIWLENEQDEVYFEDVSDHLTYPIPSSSSLMDGQPFVFQPSLKSKIFIDKNLLQVHDDKLSILCEMKVSIDDQESKERNTSEDLYYLHCDLELLLNDQDFHDIVIHMGERHYGINASLMQARLPGYQSLVHEYGVVSENLASIIRKKPHCPLINLSPRRILHVYDSVLAEAMFNVWTRQPPDPFFEPVRFCAYTIIESFTPAVCKALVMYLYTGSVEVTHHEDVVRLSNIARCLFLYDLVHKLERHSSECHSITEMVSMWYQLRFDFLKHFQDVIDHKPLVTMLTLSDPTRTHTRKLILTLRLIKSSEVVTLECRLPERYGIPTLLAVDLTIKDSHGNMLKTLASKHLYRKDESWHPDAYIRRKDLDSKDMSCVFLAVCNNESQVTCPSYKRFDFDSPLWSAGANVWSARHLGADLWRSLSDQLGCDVVLVAQGRTMLAHTYILCCRSERFMIELYPKRNKGHKITHLVPGVEYQTLVEMVKYLYTGVLDIEDPVSVEKLLWTANDFGVHSLVNSCKCFLESQMSD